MMAGFIHCHISNNVPTDYNEDLSFLLDSKGAAQSQYTDTYSEAHKENMNASKGESKSYRYTSLPVLQRVFRQGQHTAALKEKTWVQMNRQTELL